MMQSRTILKALPHVLKEITLEGFGKKQRGKVRDFYVFDNKRIIVTTDRQSAFDVILGCIPFKGAILNQLAAFWFEQTRHIIPSHLIEVPDPNVLVAHNCENIPIEMIVRGYMTGVTKTSIWYSYQKGERTIYGQNFPDNLQKNQKLPEPIITPTTHGGGKDGHDERLTKEEILQRGLVSKKMYEQMEETALALYDYASMLCAENGLILVDTKYEFGLYKGKLMLIDEVHTPDSSRFWIKETYERRFENGEEPENFDKEFLRLWYAKKGYRGDGTPPEMSKDLIVQLAKRYIGVYEKITGKKFETFSYPIEERIRKSVHSMYTAKVTYADVGDNYETKDPIKILAQEVAKKTSVNLTKGGFEEVSQTRGESAYVWKQGNTYMASVIEGLGTKSLIADAQEIQGIREKSYYNIIAHDSVASIINDLVTVGARPLIIQAYWAIEDNSWFEYRERIEDVVNGWKSACDIAGVSWAGGETPTLKGIITPGTIDLGGSAVGIIEREAHLLLQDKLEEGDSIILLKSNGINANGLSLARRVAKKLPKGYRSKLSDGTLYADALLTRTNIYAGVMQSLFNAGIPLHYSTNITGHGFRKIMRATQPFTYILKKVFEPQEIFSFIQRHAGLSEKEMYATFNMGNDFALFLPTKYVQKAQQVIAECGFASIHAGHIEKGEKQVVILAKEIVFSGESLQVRA